VCVLTICDTVNNDQSLKRVRSNESSRLNDANLKIKREEYLLLYSPINMFLQSQLFYRVNYNSMYRPKLADCYIGNECQGILQTTQYL